LQESFLKITKDTIDKVIQQVLEQDDSEIIQLIQILSIFHDLRPHQADLLAETISIISHQKQILLDPCKFIQQLPVLAYKLFESGNFSRSDVLVHSKKSGYFSFLLFPPNVDKFMNDKDLFRESPIPEYFTTQYQQNPTNFPITDLRKHGYEQGTIGYFLKYDDFDGFQTYSTFPNFTFDTQISISPNDLPLNVQLENQSFLSISAFYGSIQCFKFLLLNGMKVAAAESESAVRGGHLEIIRLCEQQHGEFRNCLSIAIGYYRNDVADWLLNTFELSDLTTKDAAESTNFKAIFYLIGNGVDVNEKIVIESRMLKFMIRF
jgi:hypothetical protein